MSGLVVLHGLDQSPLVARAPLQFLIDTGSNRTMIVKSELIRFGIIPQEFERFSKSTSKLHEKFYGIGDGDIVGYPIDASIFLGDGFLGKRPARLLCHKIRPLIVARSDGVKMPNILGRDVLNCFRMHYFFPKTLTAKDMKPDGIHAIERVR